MKTSIMILVVGMGLFSLPASLSAQSFSGSRALANRAFLSSPRTLEEYPELLRTPRVVRDESKAERLAKLTKDRALAASPRFLEEHPELLRPEPSPEELLAQRAKKRKQLHKLMENRALAASPRFLEKHPEALNTTDVFTVAPLK